MVKPIATRASSGLTLVELLVAVGVVSLMVVIAIPAYEAIRERARKAKCMSQMRVIHSGFVAHITDVGHWPQIGENESEEARSEAEYFGFWITVLEPYGVNEDTWMCPSDRRFERLPKPEQEKVVSGSYVVTGFDDKPSTPFRWSQPWAVERAGFHKGGIHILMPDGSVQSANNPFAGR